MGYRQKDCGAEATIPKPQLSAAQLEKCSKATCRAGGPASRQTSCYFEKTSFSDSLELCHMARLIVLVEKGSRSFGVSF